MSDNDKIKSHLRQLKDQFGDMPMNFKGRTVTIGEFVDIKIAMVDDELAEMHRKEGLHGKNKINQ